MLKQRMKAADRSISEDLFSQANFKNKTFNHRR